ncbi:MAG: hypothetical protein Kow00124_31810 [Anaerolineae bacterium]
MSHWVFVSYARTDWDQFVEPLVRRLRAEGFNVWVDQDLIRGGEDWMDRINEALRRCGHMVLCISPQALNSRYVKMEYRYFFHKDKPIIPIILRESDLPAELLGYQYLHYRDVDRVVEALRARLPSPGP